MTTEEKVLISQVAAAWAEALQDLEQGFPEAKPAFSHALALVLVVRQAVRNGMAPELVICDAQAMLRESAQNLGPSDLRPDTHAALKRAVEGLGVQ